MFQTEIYVKNQSLVGRQVEDGLVLVSPQNGEIKVLNMIGGMVWNMLDGHTSVSTIEHALQAQFDDTPREAIKADLERFITELVEKGLIQAA